MTPAALDTLFAALGDADRRAILQVLSKGMQSVDGLAAATRLSAAAVTRGLGALCDAGLVRPVPRREGWYAVNRASARAVQQATAAVFGAADDDVAAGADPDPLEQQAQEWGRQWPALDPDIYRVGHRLLRLSAHMERAVKEAAASQQLQGAELLLLDALVTAGPPHVATPTQLQRSLQMTPGGVTKCIQRLEQAGLVRRSPDPQDGRGVLVAILPRGRERLRAIVSQGLYGTDWVASMQMAPKRRHQLSVLLRELLFLADEELRRRQSAAP